MPTTFRIASLNVLGAGHTAQGRRHATATPAARERMASGRSRDCAPSGSTSSGFQELEKSQFAKFTQMTSRPVRHLAQHQRTAPGFLRNSIA